MANPANSTAYLGPDGRQWVDVTENKTLTIADSGYVQNVVFDNAVITLPATAVIGFFIIRNGGVPLLSGNNGSGSDGSAKVSVSPVAADRIQGGVDGTATDDKDLINTKATSNVGDEVAILSGGETNGPVVAWIRGTWAREA